MSYPRFTKPMERRMRVISIFTSVLIYSSAIYVYSFYYESETLLKFSFSLFFPVFTTYIFVKLILATSYRYATINDDEVIEQIHQASVALLVPFYNEKVELIREQVISIHNQTKPFDAVYFIDDGSAEDDVANYLKKVCDKIPNFHLYVLEENVGKREAQGKVIQYISEEYIMTTDSDTILKEDCLHELMIPFFEKHGKLEVAAVTGKVVATNEAENILTRILNMRYFNAFESERAAQSSSNSVIVASGPCTVYKSEIIIDNLDEYLNQIFLGKKQTYGDDRCLTNIALRYGDVFYQSTAVALTSIPNSLRGFTIQQTRWNRSFFRESYLGIITFSKLKRFKPLMWIIIELVMFVMILTTIALSAYGMFIVGDNPDVRMIVFIFFLVINSIIRNIYYFNVTFKTLLYAPLYGLIHFFIVIPVKVYSLCTLKNTKWMTR